MVISDERIIEMLFDRDEQALTVADDKYGSLCQKLAYKIIGDYDEANECVNNSLFQLWNAIPPARPKSLKAYICGIVRNVAVKICREQARYNENQTNFSELIELFSGGEKIEEQLDSKILGGYINEFLSSIDKTNRKIFVMRYYYNLPTKNIASVLNINDTTVRTKLFRTREELKSFLINKGYKL
ncbi:MAG: sigma-70 family RNA polymerase sigma factor [Ruminiclostridium sp.]|nr:sigma-70 family RNA polymerase sigma factor [Ruminiclostridium sp.]